MALIPLNTFKTKTATLSTLNYDQAKGARDTGLIIDSIVFDLLFGGSTQTTFSAYQFWKHNGSNIPSDYIECLAALEHAKNITLLVATSPSGNTILPSLDGEFINYTILPPFIGDPATSDNTKNKISAEFDLIMDIIRNGPQGTSDLVIPNSINETTDADMNKAIDRITTNKLVIANEVRGYINSTFNYGYVYDETKCSRDTGLIVDALAFDLLFSGTSQTTFAGLQYWTHGSSTVLVNSGETIATTIALTRIKSVIQSLILNQQVENSNGNSLASNIDFSVTGSLTSKIRASQLLNTIITIINHGMDLSAPNGIPDITTNNSDDVSKVGNITDLIISNGGLTSDDGFLNAATILQNNKLFIQTEVIAYLQLPATQTTIGNGFTFTGALVTDKCFRDVGFIIDSLTFDLQYGGNKQSIQSGVSYLLYSSPSDSQISSASAEELESTVYAYTYLKTVVSDVITGTPIASVYQSTEKQITNQPSGTSADADFASSNIELIIKIIKEGPTNITQNPIGLVESYSVYTKNAFDILLANRKFIQQEIIAFVDVLTQTVPIPVKEMVSGEKYTIRTKGTTTNWTSMSVEVMASDAVNTRFIYNGTLPNGDGMVFSGYKFPTYTDTLSTPTSGGSPLQIGKAYEIASIGSTDWNYPAGTTSITYAVGSRFVATTTSYSGTGTVYEESSLSDKSMRDIFFVLECVAFDMKYGGNRQAIHAGVYYFNNDSGIQVLAAETTCSLNAFNYMGIIINTLLNHEQLSQAIINPDQNGTNYPDAPYQNKVSSYVNFPMFNATAPSTSADIILELQQKIYYPSGTTGGLIDVMNRIINNGIPSPEPARIPIGMAKTSDANTILAADIIMTNKNYIIAEINGYMNSSTSINSTKIYTTPPGVTAIVLMASAANVTDHDVTVTLAHYRNLPVYPDPATLNGYQPKDTITELVKEFTIPPNDASGLTSGKLIIETFDSVVAYASESNGIKLTLSILETANA